MVGSSVIQFSSDFEADIGIYGYGSVTDHNFAMEHEEVKADLSKSIIKNSRESWLVADASKWGRFAALKVASLNDFDRIYTNNTQLPSELNIHLVEDEAHQ